MCPSARAVRWRCAAAVGLLGLVVGAGSGAGISEPSAPVSVEPAAPPGSAADERRHSALHGRYARARLQLAEAGLARAEALGRALSHQVPQRELRSLRRTIDILQSHLAVTQRHPHGNSYTLARCMARAAMLQADEDLATARAANERHAGTASPEAIGVLEARAEVAEARLALWEDPAFLDTPLAVMQMQIDQLSDQMLELDQRIDAPTVDGR